MPQKDVAVRSGQGDRIAEFEALRGLMALWVVAGHVLHTVDSGWEHSRVLRILSWNPYAVDVFIALSGFVIFALLDRQHAGYRAYIARRALRLFPVYLLFLVLSLLTLPVALQVLEPDLAMPRALARYEHLAGPLDRIWEHLAWKLPLLHGLVPSSVLPQAEYSFIGQAWSITVEWQFYLVAPLLLPLFLRHPVVATVALAAAAAGSQVFLGDIMNAGFVGFYLGEFLMGMLAYLVWRRRDSLSRWQLWAILAGCVVVAVPFLRYQLSVSIWLCAFAATLFLHRPEGAGLAPLRQLVVDNPVAQFLGRVSYSVYLSHMVVLYLAAWLLRLLWPDQPLDLATLMVLTMAGTLLLSQFTYAAVEHPCIRFGKTLFAARPDPVAGARAGFGRPQGAAAVEPTGSGSGFTSRLK